KTFLFISSFLASFLPLSRCLLPPSKSLFSRYPITPKQQLQLSQNFIKPFQEDFMFLQRLHNIFPLPLVRERYTAVRNCFLARVQLCIYSILHLKDVVLMMNRILIETRVVQVGAKVIKGLGETSLGFADAGAEVFDLTGCEWHIVKNEDFFPTPF